MTVKTIEVQPSEKKKLRVAAYCRVSTDNDDQRESLETQKAHYEAWIRLHSEWECAGIFYDFGITGTKADVRDGLQALMYECRIGRIDYVLTKSVSRFSRNTTDCLELVRDLLSYNVPIYFEKEKLDTGSMETELVLAILSSLAQEESESISKNVKWGNQKRIKNGRYRAGTAPYGYTFDSDGNYAIIPEEADIVRFIFESVVSGMGVHKIGKELGSRGVQTRKGGKWSTTTIMGILNNEKYVGDVRYNKTYTDDNFRRHRNKGDVDSPEVKDHHEAIISREMYATAHEVLEQRLRERGIRRDDEKYQRRFAFSGKIICGECGSTFKRQVISSGISWCCKKHIADKDSCLMKFIHEEAFQSAFTTMLNKLIFTRKILLRPYYNALRLAGSDENLQRIADAFVRYCADMLGKYPLKLRSLVGMRTPDGSIPIYKDGVVPLFVKVPGINAYVRGTLSDEDVISYINWIQSRCGEKTVYVSVIESQNSQITPDVNGIEITNDNSTVTVSNVILSDYDSTVQENLSLTDIIEQYVLATDLQGASFDDIKKHTQTTMLDVKRAVVGSMLLVEVNGRVIHKEAFVDWEEGANQLENIMEKLMKKNNGYISASQLYEFAKVEMNMFLNDNDLNDERSVFDIAAHLFGKEDYHGKHYSFIGKTHISRSNQQVTANIDIYRNYAAEQGGFFYLSSLEEYLISVGLSISNLRAQMRIPNEPIFFYYDAGMLICADSMHIDDDWFNSMKKELHDLLMDTDGHIIMRLIPEIWLERLPTLPGRKLWTPLLLQSILRCYSKELGVRTIQALKGQSIETLHSMLVSNDSPIQTFGDVVVLYLVENEISKRDFEAEKLRLMLVDAGIIQGNELIWNMHKALDKDERFAWNATNDHVTVDI